MMDEWILDRMPDSDGEYLCLYDWGNDWYSYKVLTYYKENIVLNGRVLYKKGWNCLDDPMNNATDWSVDMVAWMPLPAPIKR